MKILFVTDEIPFPPNNGIRIVSYNAMRLMHERGHDICLCTLTAEHSEPANGLPDRFASLSRIISSDSWWMRIPTLSRLTQLIDTLSGKLTFLQQYKNHEFERKLISTIRDFKPDVVHFDFINMTQYIDCLPKDVGSIASINDCHTLTLQNRLSSDSYSGFNKWVKKLQLRLTRRYEIKQYPRFGYTHLMTEIDAAYLQQLNPAIKTWVIPNGVDDELFTIKDTDVKNVEVIFVGKIFGNNFFSLKRFIEEGWPIVKAAASNATLNVFGQVGEEAQQWVSNISAVEENVHFRGYQSRLATAYENSAVAIVPINKNSGIVNKALEALAAGVAVVSFHSTFEGIEHAKENTHYLGASSYSELGECVQQLLADPAKRLAVAKAGRDLAARYYAWPAKGAEYEEMYLAAKEIAISSR